MFSTITAFAQKYRVIVVIFWVAVAFTLFIAAPKFSSVAVTDESQFLPQNTQSSLATKLLEEKFPAASQAPASTGTIVIYNPNGLNNQDTQAAKSIRDWLLSDSAPGVIEGVNSIFDNDLLRQSLVSQDQTTMIMQVNFSVSSLSDSAKTAVSQIREYLSKNHPNVKAYFTGENGLLQDMFQSIQQTISKTTIVTIILVLIILLIIYRSPVAALLPLITIGCSFLTIMGILSFLGQAGVKFFTLAEAYLVVIIFGIGTDYCLFIVSRFREELRNNGSNIALDYSMRHIGPVIAASALTVIVAFLCLGLSRFGMNKTVGYALALGIAITLIAGLTLIPALISIFGRYLFWPARASTRFRTGRFSWAKVGDWVVRHPLAVTLPIIAVLLIPYIAFSHFTQTNDIISQMPANTQSVQGYKLLEKHFPPGQLAPVYVLIESPEKDITSPASLQSITQIAQSLEKVAGISNVNYYSASSNQLTEMATQIRMIGDKLDEGNLAKNIPVLQTSSQILKGLILQYPEIVKSQNFQMIETDFSKLTHLIAQLSTNSTTDLTPLLIQQQKTLYDIANNLDALANEFNLKGSSLFVTSLTNTYFSADKTTARINISLNTSPYSPETVDTITRLREASSKSINISALKGSSFYVGGESAIRADIMLTNSSDFGIVVGFAIAGILAVIMILLRSILAPIYMVATVLLNYGATLGIISWLFSSILKHTGIIYMLPIFIFIILVALGADYNIFLVSRIREEARQRPLKEAISHAIANTGGIITSCGIILAGTFATLTTAPLQMVMQLGLAIVIGVIVDTFVVRALLVPAIATLVGRWSWWPTRLQQPPKK